MTWIQPAIRVTLSIVLIVFIYRETGPATTIFAALMTLVCEAQAELNRTGRRRKP